MRPIVESDTALVELIRRRHLDVELRTDIRGGGEAPVVVQQLRFGVHGSTITIEAPPADYLDTAPRESTYRFESVYLQDFTDSIATGDTFSPDPTNGPFTGWIKKTAMVDGAVRLEFDFDWTVVSGSRAPDSVITLVGRFEIPYGGGERTATGAVNIRLPLDFLSLFQPGTADKIVFSSGSGELNLRADFRKDAFVETVMMVLKDATIKIPSEELLLEGVSGTIPILPDPSRRSQNARPSQRPDGDVVIRRAVFCDSFTATNVRGKSNWDASVWYFDQLTFGVADGEGKAAVAVNFSASERTRGAFMAQSKNFDLSQMGLPGWRSGRGSGQVELQTESGRPTEFTATVSIESAVAVSPWTLIVGLAGNPVRAETELIEDALHVDSATLRMSLPVKNSRLSQSTDAPGQRRKAWDKIVTSASLVIRPTPEQAIRNPWFWQQLPLPFFRLGATTIIIEDFPMKRFQEASERARVGQSYR